MTMKKGSTLIELLVGMSVFAVLSVSISMVITTTLRSAARASVVAKVKSDGTYIMDAMSTVVRFAADVQCDSQQVSAKLASVQNTIIYECFPTANPPYIASDSASLNSNETKFTACSITCTESENVEFDFSLRDVDETVGAVNFNSQVVLRNR